MSYLRWCAVGAMVGAACKILHPAQPGSVIAGLLLIVAMNLITWDDA